MESVALTRTGALRSTARGPIVAVLAAATLFGTTGTALALGPSDASAVSVGTIRLLVGGCGLVLVSLMTGSVGVPRRIGPLALGAGAVASYQLCFFHATTSTGVALATVLTIGTSPLAARAIGVLRGRSSPGAWWYRAAGLLGVGLIVLVIGNGGATRFDPLGVLAAVMAGISYAGYTECGAVSLDAGADSTATMAAMFLGGGILASPLLFTQDLAWLGRSSGVVMILYLSVITLTISYVWFGWGLAHLAPTTVVMLTMFEPVVAAVLAIVVLDERLSLQSWIGIAVVLLGLSIVGQGARRPLPLPTTVTP